MKRMRWSGNYHGVSYLLGIPSGHQVQLTAYADGTAEAKQIVTATFGTLREFLGPEDAARREAERWGLALHILAECPNSRERSLALTKLEEAVMWANAAIARNE